MELCCEYLSVRWLYAIIMSQMDGWLNGWLFAYKLSGCVNGCEFEPCCCQLNFRYCTCFEQDVPWHSCNYIVWIQSETHTWHDNNMQSGRSLYAYQPHVVCWNCRYLAALQIFFYGKKIAIFCSFFNKSRFNAN